MTYRITTLAPGTGRYTPQIGIPEYVAGFAGLRRALRGLRELGYEARRGDCAVKIERINPRSKP